MEIYRLAAILSKLLHYTKESRVHPFGSHSLRFNLLILLFLTSGPLFIAFTNSLRPSVQGLSNSRVTGTFFSPKL